MLKTLFLNLFILSTINAQELSSSTLQFVQVWFRHGERLPTHFLVLPGDPNPSRYNEITEAGELTNKGIQQEYQLGLNLKEKYGEFLGSYKPSEIHIWTGKDNRTVASALAATAALFPPNELQKWSEKLNWYPVAVHTDQSIDWVSTGIDDVCPIYSKTFFESPAYKNIIGKIENEELFDVIRKNLPGIPLDDPRDVNHILDSLFIRNILSDERLPLPQWAKPIIHLIFPTMVNIHDHISEIQDPIMGYHREQILAFFEDHLNRKKKNKAVLVSGHDTNFIILGKALGITEMSHTLPYFGGQFVAELHHSNNTYYVKFYHTTQIGAPVQEVVPPYCNKVCTLQDIQDYNKYERVSKDEIFSLCLGVTTTDHQPVVTGSLIALLAVLLISTVILTFTTYSYRRQLMKMKDPEQHRLI